MFFWKCSGTGKVYYLINLEATQDWNPAQTERHYFIQRENTTNKVMGSWCSREKNFFPDLAEQPAVAGTAVSYGRQN